MSVRKNLRSVHKWLALSLLLLFVMQTLSGVGLVYRDEIQNLLVDAYPVHPAEGNRYDVDAYLQVLQSQYPDYRVKRIEYSDRKSRPLVAHLLASYGTEKIFLLIDPYSGDVIRKLEGFELLPFWLFEFHKELTLGYPGEFIVALEGFGLLVMMVTGLVLWWPSRKIIRRQFSRQGSPLVRRLNLHRVTGLLGIPFLLLTIGTGTVVASKIVLSGPPVCHQPPLVEKPVPINRLVGEQIERRDGDVVDIRFSKDLAQVTLNFEAVDVIRPLATDRIQIDRRSGEVIGEKSAVKISGASEVYAWMYPLHSGKFAGIVGKILALTAGMILLMLSVFGLRYHFERRKMDLAKKLRTQQQNAFVSGF